MKQLSTTTTKKRKYNRLLNKINQAETLSAICVQLNFKFTFCIRQ